MGDGLRIYLFGEPRFEVCGERHAFKAPPKTLPLLAYLLLHRRGPVAREMLAAALWPDDDDAAAFGNLRRHLHYLTKALPPAPSQTPWITADKKTIGWNTRSPYWLDVEVFEVDSQDRQLRARAVRLYNGDLYERCSEEWIDFERERLRTLQMSNLAQLCAAARKRSSYVEALQYAQLILAADPWREDAVRAIMETRMLLGDRGGALAEYERFAARLQEDLQTEPLAETTQAYQRIVRSVEDTAAQPRPDRAPEVMLVGRRNELAILQDEWQRAARGEGRVVFLGGEAGVGKSTLLESLYDAALESGAVILSAAASVHEETAYAAFLGIAHDIGADLVTAVSTDDERLRMFETFAAALEARAREKAILLAVEDLHWAGKATLDLLRYLALRLAQARVLIVGTYREFAVTRGHPLRALRRQITQSQRCSSIALSCLGREEVRELACSRAGRALADQVVERIYERSDGNPLFVIELVRELQNGPLDRIPSSIAEIVRERVARLKPETQPVLEIAALAGSSFSAELLNQVTGMRERDVLTALDELIASHFLRQTQYEHAFSFVHEVIREAVAAQVSPLTARSAHARLGFALRDLHAERFNEIAAAVARHFECAGLEEEALDAYLAAAEHAHGVYAVDEAESYAKKALDYAVNAQERFRALAVLESACANRADRRNQQKYLDELVAVAQELGPAQRADAAARDADFSSGEDAERQMQALNRFKHLLVESPDREPAYLLRLGEYLSRLGQMHEAKDVLQQTLERLSAGDDADALVRCLTALFLVSLSTGDPLGEIEQNINLARARLERAADARLAARLAFIQAGASVDRDPAAALEYAQRMLEHARTAGDVMLEASAHRSCGAAATRQMQLGLAQEHFRRCAELTISAGRTRDLARVRNWQLQLANRIGDFAAAERYGEEGLRAAIAANAADSRAAIISNLANTAMWAGDPGTAERRLREAIALGDERGYAQPGVVSLLGEVHIVKGHLDEGIEMMERARDSTAPRKDALGVAKIHDPVLLGLAYLAAGRTADALACAQSIRELLATFERYFMHPQAHLWAGAQLLKMCGYDEDAKTFMQAARERREAILATIHDEASRECFRRFVFNELIAAGALVDDPLEGWFVPSRHSAIPRPARSRRGAQR